MLWRFNDTAQNRYDIIQVFRELEREYTQVVNVLPETDAWDKDDDPEGPEPKPSQFPPGSTFGTLKIENPDARCPTQ